MGIADIAITSLDTITAYDLAGEYRFTLDELQDATISNTQETEDVTGKGGRKLATLKRNKSVTVSGNNGLLSAGLLEAQVGSKFEAKESTPVQWFETLVVKSNAATSSYAAVGTAGKEISACYVIVDGIATTKLEQAQAADAGKFTYAEKTFAFSGLEDGTEVYVAYTRNIKGDVLENSSEKYSQTLHLFIDATGEDRCGNVYRVQFEIPKADFNGEFDLEMSDSQLVHAFEATSLSGVCGAKGALWVYTVFGVNAEDA